MGRKLLLTLWAVTLLVPPSLQAAARQEVQGITPRQQGLKVIEEKCLFCHNRHRIDEAVKERKDMERITRRMEKKGVVLTEKERQVFGHFWRQDPFKAKGGKAEP